MTQLLLTDLDDELLTDLQERADRHGRTPPEEAKAILLETLSARRLGSWAEVHAIFEEISLKRVQTTDSVDLLREDRER